MKLSAHKTKIVCTIGPASRSEAILERLMLQGMNVARLNFAHGTVQGHKEDIRRIRTVAAKLQRHCLIMVDLPGPKIRIGKLLNEPLLLEKGDEVILNGKNPAGTPNQIPVEYKRLPESVKPGSLIFLNDGFIQLQVEKVSGAEVFCRTMVGGPLLSHKGLHLPGVKVVSDAVSASDLALVDFALKQGIDTFGLSFVQSADDIGKVRRFSRRRNKSIQAVAKIERAEAIDNFQEILEAADAVMIARGDLGVQIPLENVPAVQKKLIHRTNLMGRPVITATQMLVSMTENIRPTRAEVSDVANAILDGTDAVMLSEETAIGRYPVEAVEMMARIAASVEGERQTIKALSDLTVYFKTGEGFGKPTVEDIISLNAVEAARALEVGLIMTQGQSGTPPRLISRFKPDSWIFSFGGDAKMNDFLTLSYGVFPVFMKNKKDQGLERVIQFLERSGMVGRKGQVVLVSDDRAKGENVAGSLKILTLPSKPVNQERVNGS